MSGRSRYGTVDDDDQAPEQSGQPNNPGKGKKQKGGDRNLYKEMDGVKREIEQLKAKQLVNCAFCKGTGKMPDAKGKPALDDNNLPIPCPVCHGAGQTITKEVKHG